MSTSLPPSIILPTGQPAFLNPYRGTYTTNRAYALRMQRGYARGISRQTARGHAPGPAGLTEYQVRAQRFEQQYGFSYSTYRRWQRRYISEINAMSSPEAQITPMVLAQDIATMRQVYGTGIVPGIIIPPENRTEERLAAKLYAMQEYQAGDPMPGRQDFYTRETYRPIEMYWYH
jgi:hypothetical protein